MQDLSSRKILVIEDDRQFCAALARTLRGEGFHVETCENGLEAIALAQKIKPALIVCDLHLPAIEGSAVLSRLREDGALELCQFILITGDARPFKRREGMNLGADDYLEKPFTMEVFLASVQARLRRFDRHRRVEERAIVLLRETVSHTLPHEIFTPLTGILCSAELLKDEFSTLPAVEARDLVANIHESADRLYRTLKNYLAIIDLMNNATLAGGWAPGETPGTTVVGIFERIADEALRRYTRKADFVFLCSPIGVPVSENVLRMILLELLDNACKFSLVGSKVSLELQAVAGESILTVRDEGRGISLEQVALLGAFRQFDRNKYEQQGLGLGLTLAQHLVQRSGGVFRMESKLGTGTTVRVSWPQFFPEKSPTGASAP